jgi:hypothetical protein
MYIKLKNFQDEKVKNMCVALWMKLKYAYEQRRNHNKFTKGLANGTRDLIKTTKVS